MSQKRIKADLHVHSRFSTRPSQWILQKIGCPESFTDPVGLYETARARGMDFVTIADHNTIDGALEIAHLPGTFVSEEITTYFPDDGCKLHVLAWNINEQQHRDIQQVRDNVFELVPYLRSQDICHALAHPLFAVNDRLTLEHFEQALLMFNVMEANGSRDSHQNESLTQILESLTPRLMDRLANRYNIDPLGETPWIKSVVGGSDDHSSINIARMHTEIQCDGTISGMLDAIENGQCKPSGRAATPETFSHNLYGIAYQFYVSRANLSSTAKEHICIRFAENGLNPTRKRETDSLLHRMRTFIDRSKAALHTSMSGPAKSGSVQEIMLNEAAKIIQSDDRFKDIARGVVTDLDYLEAEMTRFISQASNRILHQFADRTLQSLTSANLFDIFHSIGSAGSLYTLLAPYFVGYDLFSRERAFCDHCIDELCPGGIEKKHGMRIAHFTDTFDEINGVAKTIRQQLDLVTRHGKVMNVITCGSTETREGLINFEPIGSFDIPDYPEITVSYPPLLDMLRHCFEHEYDCILAATPGPVGLVGLAISKILKLPFHGTYHTAFPQYVGALTEDTSMEEGCLRYMTWFYNQMQVIYAPSEATRQELIEMGIDQGKITTYPRGVDVERFHPSKRNGFFKRFDIADGTKLLYVGRVSKEKGLDVLTEAFRTLSKMRPYLRLAVVGDGPYLREMKRKLRGTPATFTGALHGDDLAAAYASSDLFVFPSTTDTFGNVVLEAQASGLPCVVTDMGGPSENIEHNETGLVIEGDNPDALTRAILHLTDTPERLEQMRLKARKLMEHRTFDNTFLETWNLFKRSAY